MSLPFPLDTPITKLARSYLAVAGNKPQSTYTTGDPLGFIDSLALDYLTTHEMLQWVDGKFQATEYGVSAHRSFLEQGR